MKREELSQARFRELLEAYGADFERWPEQPRRLAHALCERSAEARAARREHQAFDALFAQLTPEKLPDSLEARVLAVPRTRQRVVPFRARTLWVPALGWATAAALGLWLGAQSSASDVSNAESAGTALTANADEEQLLALTSGAVDDWVQTP